jgi:hypothetical protein
LKRDAFARAHASRFSPWFDRAIQTYGDSASGHRAPGSIAWSRSTNGEFLTPLPADSGAATIAADFNRYLG